MMMITKMMVGMITVDDHPDDYDEDDDYDYVDHHDCDNDCNSHDY